MKPSRASAETAVKKRHKLRAPRWNHPSCTLRAIWLLLVILTVGFFVASVPHRFAILLQSMPAYEQALLRFFTSSLYSLPYILRAIILVGISDYALAIYFIVLESLTMLAFAATASVILWRKPNDYLAIFISLSFLAFGSTVFVSAGALEALHSVWSLPIRFVKGLGWGAILIAFYVFPDGRFIPHWTKWMAVLWGGASLIWPFTPANTLLKSQSLLPLTVSLIALGSGIFAQLHRYRRVSTPVQRQETKWAVFGSIAPILGFIFFTVTNTLINLNPSDQPEIQLLLYNTISYVVFVITLLFAPLFIGASILGRRLWDIDAIINSAVVYGAVTGLLAIVYFVEILIFQKILQAFTGQTSTIVVALSTLIVAALFKPALRRMQRFIDRRFYRHKLDFRETFLEFSREVCTTIDLPELLKVLTGRISDLFYTRHGAIFLRDSDGQLSLSESHKASHPGGVKLSLSDYVIKRLQAGSTVTLPPQLEYALLAPLLAPWADSKDLVGVLALGPRRFGKLYTGEDKELLMGLADQAGTAIYVAQLIAEKQAEAQRKELAEQRLQAHRQSPIGQAELLAENLLAQPENALSQLYQLTQRAGEDPDAAGLIGNLPGVLEGLDAGPISDLAEGYNYVLMSQYTPEVLSVGLRRLTEALTHSPRSHALRGNAEPDAEHPNMRSNAEHWNEERTDSDSPRSPRSHALRGNAEPDAEHPNMRSNAEHWNEENALRWNEESEGLRAEALAIYQLCQTALDAGSIPRITQLLPSFALQPFDAFGRTELSIFSGIAGGAEGIEGLSKALVELQTVVETLRAYERVESSGDKLAYLVSAVDQLRRVDHWGRSKLNAADRPIIRRIVERWLLVVTRAMSELQTSAHIVCRLLTRRTWYGDIISLVFSLHNDGQGAALNLDVRAAPSAEYTLVEDATPIDRLASGEETQVELRVRLHLAESADHFRIRFNIHYTDPRGPDQIENYADVVHLLAAEGEFQFIPNPYVVGTPLQTGSSLFFGQEDVIASIEENLTAGHRNNLTLIGQRRTGKTSLLKQLPAHLSQTFISIYIDGQTLGLDPGLPNFFLTLATEIAFALEDYGYDIEAPELEDFQDSPAASFERRFLPAVRQAIGAERHILILLDEFEELETAVRRGNLDPSIFGFWRHLIQHTDNLSVIFCGTHRLEELAADYWNILFNISLYRHISFLAREEALRLIQEPVAEYGMRYDDLALEKMWRVTAGHPYFLQLLAHSLVNQHNRTERNYVTVGDVNTALDEIMASGEAHFIFLWMEASRDERLVLAALSRMIPLTGQTSAVQICDYLAERGLSIERSRIEQALYRLTLRDMLQTNNKADEALGETYRWKLGLLGLWVEKYKSFNRVIDEVQP